MYFPSYTLRERLAARNIQVIRTNGLIGLKRSDERPLTKLTRTAVIILIAMIVSNSSQHGNVQNNYMTDVRTV